MIDFILFLIAIQYIIVGSIALITGGDCFKTKVGLILSVLPFGPIVLFVRLLYKEKKKLSDWWYFLD